MGILDANCLSNSEYPLLKVENLCCSTTVRTSLFLKRKIKICDNISFELKRGEILAISGDAGSGKTTLLKLINGALSLDSGEIMVYGKPLMEFERRDRANFIKMIHADPMSNINPHLKVYQILEQPLIINSDLTEQQRYKRITKILDQVGLRHSVLKSYPNMLPHLELLQLSFAYAFLLNSHILLVDTIIEHLDTHLISKFMNILLDNQKKHGTAIIISLNHLDLIKHFADKILILNRGKAEEYGSVKKVLENPKSDIAKRIIQSNDNEYKFQAKRII
jgi:cationic peptide transport system ATP-binding protein